MEKNEQKIIELALNGYSNQEIANKLLINVRFVDKTISDLNNPKEGIYNQDIYYKIIMEKSLHNINVIDKDLLDEIIKMNCRYVKFTPSTNGTNFKFLKK